MLAVSLVYDKICKICSYWMVYNLSVLVVGRLDMVPYIRTFVQYDGTFGASDQGQTLDV
jgi:hypothetical protein